MDITSIPNTFFCVLWVTNALIRMTRSTYLGLESQWLAKEEQALILILAVAAKASAKANVALQCAQMPGDVQIEADSTILILLPCASALQ